MTTGSFAALLCRRAGLLTLLVLLLGGAAGWATARLELRTDLAELLPEGSPSVRDLRRMQARTTGVARLAVAVEWTGAGDGTAAVEGALGLLAPALRAAIGPLPGRPAVAELDEGPGAVLEFFDRHALLYLDLDDLDELARALQRTRQRVGVAAARRNPLFIDLEGGGESASAEPGEARLEAQQHALLEEGRAELRAVRQRLQTRLEARARELGAPPGSLRQRPPGGAPAARTAAPTPAAAPTPRFLGEQGRLGVLLLRPHVALDVTAGRQLVDRVRQAVTGVNIETRISPHLRVELVGGLAQGLVEYDAFRRDIVSTAALCVALVALVVWLYFRRLRVLALLAVTLAVGAALSFAIAWLFIGYLNGPVAFLSSVIVGTGINYGIVLLARLREERARDGASRPVEESLGRALATTWRPTLLAALTTAVAFGALQAGHVLSFRHFGLVGGAGILVCWALSYTLLPALWALAERLRPEHRAMIAEPPGQGSAESTETRVRRAPRYPFFLARWPARRPRLVLAVGLVLSIAATLVTVRQLPDALEGDLSRLRTRSAMEGPLARLDARVQRLLGAPALPSVVLGKDAGQAGRICRLLEARRRLEGPAAATGPCRTLGDLVPRDQAAKLARLARIGRSLEALERRLGVAAGPAGLAELGELRRRLATGVLTAADLPAEIRRPFTERDGSLGTLALVEPPPSGLWLVGPLRRFTRAIRHLDLGGGERITSSGEAVVFADLLDNIAADAPRTSALALGLVLLVLLLALRDLRAVSLIALALLVGVVTMTGAAFLCGLKINFFNFVALPTTFGIGVDYLVNIHGRCQLEHCRAAEALAAEPPGTPGLRVGPGPGSPGETPSPVERALWTTGGAVVLCSATTAIGYVTLLIADNRALASFGALAALGEVTCLLTALLLLPAALVVVGSTSRRTDGGTRGGPLRG